VSALSGVTGSYYADTAPGAMIVVVALGLFALAACWTALRPGRGRRAASVPS
jgi:ABC-type Mn2+/Zn2+ transport system permease subunit